MPVPATEHTVSLRKAKLTGFCYVPREENKDVDSRGESQIICDVTVDGHFVKTMLVSGSSLSLLKPCFVSNVNYTSCTTVQCVPELR